MIAYYALAVHLPTRDPEAAERFLVERLGFRASARGNGWANLENGALVLRVHAGEPAAAVELEVVTRDPEGTCADLGRHDGVACMQPPTRSGTRIEARLATSFGLVLVVGRDLDEDDLGLLPPLPSELVWAPAVVRSTQELLREVPLAFRADARVACTRAAERCALARGAIEVGEDDALRGLIRATPAFRRGGWQPVLAARGIDLRAFVAEWTTP